MRDEQVMDRSQGRVKGFVWPCLRVFKDDIGQLDAEIQLTQVAVQDMLARADASGDRQLFVRDLAATRGVPVNAQKPEAVANHVARLYIVAVNSALDGFLRDLQDERPGGQWPLKDENQHALTAPEAARRFLGLPESPECQVIDYYWRIRNTVAHRLARVPNLPCNLPADLPRHGAPHLPADLDYHDFILYTACVKRFAYAVSAKARPSDDWFRGKVAEQKHLKGTSLTEARYRDRCANWLHCEYGLGRQEALDIVSEGLVRPVV